ncbi:hypothetical protein BaRGS_00011804, partial [Batillaria attramentaria]
YRRKEDPDVCTVRPDVMQTAKETLAPSMEWIACGLPRLPRLQTPVSFRPAMTQLDRCRQETAALRDVWRSLESKRQRRLPTTGASLLRHNRIPVATGMGPSEALQCKKLGDSSSRPEENALQGTKPAPASLPKVEGTSTSFSSTRPLVGSTAVTSTRLARHDDVKSPLPYHTAITRRPARTCSPSYQALTIPYEPLPQLIERPAPGAHSSAPTPRRDIREWQDQIVNLSALFWCHPASASMARWFGVYASNSSVAEVVPARPAFFRSLELQSDPSAQKRPLRYPYKVTNFDPACHFYKSWAKAMDKDFVINPEWVSEKVKVTAATTDVGRLGKKSLPVVLPRSKTWCA